ncbi:hypothetical protein [Streptomyces sp. TP-A0874]|uniref:hypothetical protein n=1 Tax=Streptomyces sp. TP-A0874 TaxID=549819 RepID=UPI00147C80C1|nr:hypothetical protein [Streptomyces sp. TP-A0874]
MRGPQKESTQCAIAFRPDATVMPPGRPYEELRAGLADLLPGAARRSGPLVLDIAVAADPTYL